MYRITLVLLLYLLVLVGCGKSLPQQTQLMEREFESGDIESVSVEFPAGRLSVSSSAGPRIFLSAAITDPQFLGVSQSGSLLSIALEKAGSQDEIILRVPDGMTLNIQTFQGDVELKNLRGTVQVRSTAGRIDFQSFTGKALLWAGRGDIHVADGQGEIVLFGEHGSLSTEGFEGSLSMTTIMGALNYADPGDAHNFVQLESDHGPVEVLLARNTNSKVAVSTTSGLVTCTGEGFSKTYNGCSGIIGAGEGEITIRTVSGRVDLKVVDLKEGAQDD